MAVSEKLLNSASDLVEIIFLCHLLAPHLLTINKNLLLNLKKETHTHIFIEIHIVYCLLLFQ